MNKTQDYYDVLGVSRGASQKEIRQAYRRLARKYHPDVNPGDKAAEERFKAISEAHNVISDAEKRKQYDQFGRAYQHAQQSGQWQGGGFEDFLRTVAAGGGGVTFGGSFADIFGDIFGRTGGGSTVTARRGGPRTPQRGEDIEHELEIPFEEAMSGAEKTISLTLSDRCQDCNGVGGKTTPCSACGGTGVAKGGGGFLNISTPCPQCQGTGDQITARCSRCGGSGEVMRSRRIRVKIPPGVDTGRRILLRGEGAAGAHGGPAGNLILRAKVGSHPTFQRRDDDILIETPVKFTEAALGAEIDVPSVWGNAKLKIPAGTKNGQTLRLRGMGVPKMGSNERGDQLVRVSIAMPPKLSQRQRELLEEFSEEWTENPRAEPKR